MRSMEMRTQDQASHIIALANEIAETAVKISTIADEETLTTLLTKSQMLDNIRKKRDAFNSPLGLFRDPSWEILLQVFSSHLGGSEVSISNLCDDLQFPVSTARRWIQILENNGFVRISGDRSENSQCFVVLTDQAISMLSTTLAD